MPIKDLDDFKALDPFFRIIEEGLNDRETGVVVLEYASRGRVVATGAPTAIATSRCSPS